MQRNDLICRGVLLFCVILSTFPLWHQAEASCHEARLCCPGRNNTCFAYGPRTREGVDGRDRCFCDQECGDMNDCCFDYTTACKAIDCEVGEYSNYGKCSNPCGVGVQVRRRKVAVYAVNGGKSCPRMKERRGCIGEDYKRCLQQSLTHRGRELREVARILPAKFGHFRSKAKYDPVRDPLRKNLFASRGYNINEILTRPAYCAQFEVIDRAPHCNVTDNWAFVLKPGAYVCLECQPLAMYKSLGMRCKGHGVYEEVTQWNAIGVHSCKGHWRMKTKHESCTCNIHGNSDFILL